MRSPRILPTAKVRTGSRRRSGAMPKFARHRDAPPAGSSPRGARSCRFHNPRPEREIACPRRPLHRSARTSAPSENPNVTSGPGALRETAPPARSSAFSTATPSRGKRLDQFAFGRRHAFDGIEEFHVRIAHVGHDSDFGCAMPASSRISPAWFIPISNTAARHSSGSRRIESGTPDMIVEIARRSSRLESPRRADARSHPWS